MRTHRTHPNEPSRAGFTLVELLVVVGIIGILAALLMPAIISAMRKAHETSTLNLIHQCEVAAQSFFNDYGDYPPSTWAEVDEFFEVFWFTCNACGQSWVSRPGAGLCPACGSGNITRQDLFQDTSSGLSSYVGNGTAGPEDTNPDRINQGIEVFTACLATRNGGPYLELSAEQLANTDGDLDADRNGDGIRDILGTTNWYFGGNQVFEIVDWWGNPLVYVHNRQYSDHDGWNPTAGAFEIPPSAPPDYSVADVFLLPWVSPEPIPYVDAEGNLVPCYSRWDNRAGRVGDPLVTMNYPNLTSFQLYSWGSDLRPGCAQSATPGFPNPHEPGLWSGWIARSRNLTNWQE